MDKLIIQIYEIQTPEEAEKMVFLGVDHVGSVVASRQKWKEPQIKKAIAMVRESGAKSSLILLFNDEKTVLEAIGYYQPDIVHFCEALAGPGEIGHCPEGFQSWNNLVLLQEKIKEKFPETMIMRSIPIAEPGLADKVPTLDLAGIFGPVSDFFLTDTLLISLSQGRPQNQPVNGFVGITGKTCDWDMAARLIRETAVPVILAGGISPDNVYDGIMKVRPAGVDSCTGTNRHDREGKPVRFQKDLNKVGRLVSETRRAEQEIEKIKTDK